jgi:hypothetical protein
MIVMERKGINAWRRKAEINFFCKRQKINPIIIVEQGNLFIPQAIFRNNATQNFRFTEKFRTIFLRNRSRQCYHFELVD